MRHPVCSYRIVENEKNVEVILNFLKFRAGKKYRISIGLLK